MHNICFSPGLVLMTGDGRLNSLAVAVECNVTGHMTLLIGRCRSTGLTDAFRRNQPPSIIKYKLHTIWPNLSFELRRTRKWTLHNIPGIPSTLYQKHLPTLPNYCSVLRPYSSSEVSPHSKYIPSDGRCGDCWCYGVEIGWASMRRSPACPRSSYLLAWVHLDRTYISWWAFINLIWKIIVFEIPYQRLCSHSTLYYITRNTPDFPFTSSHSHSHLIAQSAPLF